MKFNSIQKCQLIGYLFLVAITLVEIVLFCNILNVDSIGRKIAASIIIITFNSSVWIFALKYQTIKRALNKNDESE